MPTPGQMFCFPRRWYLRKSSAPSPAKALAQSGIHVPLIANMTEFGKTPYVRVVTLQLWVIVPCCSPSVRCAWLPARLIDSSANSSCSGLNGIGSIT